MSTIFAFDRIDTRTGPPVVRFHMTGVVRTSNPWRYVAEVWPPNPAQPRATPQTLVMYYLEIPWQLLQQIQVAGQILVETRRVRSHHRRESCDLFTAQYRQFHPDQSLSNNEMAVGDLVLTLPPGADRR